MALRRAAGLAPEDGLLWSEHPLGRKLLQRVMEYHGSKGDVETLAAVGCVLRSHACTEADSQAAGHDHGTPELPPSKADTRALARGKALQAGDSDPPPAAAAATSAMTSAKSSTTSLSSGSGSDAGAKSPTLSLSPRQRRWMQLSGDTAAVATPATQRKVCTRKSLAFDLLPSLCYLSCCSHHAMVCVWIRCRRTLPRQMARAACHGAPSALHHQRCPEQCP